ncbi:hypothetical protein HOLleu_14001 [Holothuria leucospilota]|uniref:Uncharacterized protein n=1 Tax=Holothuria leucospilota TaxID=206669 RepID=A0A9Q1C833_HOLLE|nr:hypothetical protein HOLleu_14001 [Holothuria leucospilota]
MAAGGAKESRTSYSSGMFHPIATSSTGVYSADSSRTEVNCNIGGRNVPSSVKAKYHSHQLESIGSGSQGSVSSQGSQKSSASTDKEVFYTTPILVKGPRIEVTDSTDSLDQEVEKLNARPR